ncbi:MAG: hypothetical protein U0670_20625 [Anaerolineae bacterium]
MVSLRAWKLTPSHPLALQIAADARISASDYLDDQVWELILGQTDAPGLVAQTRYGERVGIATLIPMWWIDNRAVYQYQAYAVPPVVTAFAPGYLEITAKITPRLALRAEYWVESSHHLCVRYSLKNSGSSAQDLRLDLVGFVGASGAERPIKPASRVGGLGANGISFGAIGRTIPLIMLEDGTPLTESTSAKLTTKITVKAGGTATLRWVHVGAGSLADAFKEADDLLKVTWTPAFRKITQNAQAIPQIETGDLDADAAIGFAYQQLMQSFMDATSSMPHPSVVGARQPTHGYSRSGNGTDHPRSWSGQTPSLAYLTALATAPINADLAEGLLRNYLAFQQADGWIDAKPGLAGQKANLLCLPILSRLAWDIYTISGNTEFLREVFPALARFLNRWLRPDMDADKDGLPEWTNEQQTGFPFLPTFAVGLGYGANVDIRTVEAPDLAAYLLSEAVHLQRIGTAIGDTSLKDKLPGIVDTLKQRLDSLWHGNRYTYQDRDSNGAPPVVSVLQQGRADEEHFPAVTFDAPRRLVMQVIGGLDRVPSLVVHVQGLDAKGAPVHERLENKAFYWANGRGVTTSTALYSQVDRIRIEGLSRVYKINVDTVDYGRRDVTSLLPLWTRGLTPERAAAVAQQATDPAHFWLNNGLAMISAQDRAFPSVKTGEGGGIWMYWATLIGEGLFEAGFVGEAVDLVKRILRVQTQVLKDQHAFSEFYHSSDALGLGERGNTAGLVPLHLLNRVLGVQIASKTRVNAGGAFLWGSPVTVRAHGVTVVRSENGTTITFPSKHTVQLAASESFQTILDPGEGSPESH